MRATANPCMPEPSPQGLWIAALILTILAFLRIQLRTMYPETRPTVAMLFRIRITTLCGATAFVTRTTRVWRIVPFRCRFEPSQVQQNQNTDPHCHEWPVNKAALFTLVQRTQETTCATRGLSGNHNGRQGCGKTHTYIHRQTHTQKLYL